MHRGGGGQGRKSVGRGKDEGGPAHERRAGGVLGPVHAVSVVHGAWAIGGEHTKAEILDPHTPHASFPLGRHVGGWGTGRDDTRVSRPDDAFSWPCQRSKFAWLTPLCART